MGSSNNANFADWVNRQQKEFQQKYAAWLRASAVQGYDPDHVRIDAYGALIVWGDYGQTSDFGWEIDHELPKSVFPDFSKVQANMRALHWRNNRAKSNTVDLNSLRHLLGGS